MEIFPFLKVIYEMRGDLRQLYNLDTESGRDGLLMWWSFWGHKELPNLKYDTVGLTTYLLSKKRIMLAGESIDLSRAFIALCEERVQVKTTFLGDVHNAKRGESWFFCHFIVEERLEWWLPRSYVEADVKGLDMLGKAYFLYREIITDLNDPDYLQWVKKRVAYRNEDLIPVLRQREFSAPKGFGVNIVGHATGELGVGEDARMMAQALSAVGIPYSIFKFPFQCLARDEDKTLASEVSEDIPYSVNIFCLPGFDCFYAMGVLGESFFDGRHNVAYSPWELPKWPESLEIVFPRFNDFWMSTQFALDSLANLPESKKALMHYNVTLPEVSKKTREEWGLKDGVFYFLFAFDFISSIYRKNPYAVLESFKRAFPHEDMSVGLIIKSTYRDPNNPDVVKVADWVKSDPRVIWINDTMPRADYLSLIKATDCFVSLHRSEGFGRNLAEAMLLKRPVIATNWSGNVDFCHVENSYPVKYSLVPVKENEYSFPRNQHWADVDIDDAAKQMRAVVSDSQTGILEKKLILAYNEITEKHSKETSGKQYAERLRNKINAEKL